MKVQRNRGWCGALVGALVLLAGWRSDAIQCVVCQQPIRDAFLWMGNPVFGERQAVCSACAALDTVCSTCQLPVKRGFLKLDDGRLLCATHGRDAVTTQRGAEEVFAETKREMFRLLRGCGAMPDRNVTVSLLGKPELERLAQEGALGDDPSSTVGLTRSRREGEDFTHAIHLLNGLGRNRLMTVSAHEYMHAWMRENVPADRGLDRDTTEGFCELVAYKLACDQRLETEKKLILANAYTRGQTGSFVKAEDAHRFYQIVQWIKSGVGERLESTNSATALALRPEADSAPVLPNWPQAVKTAVPDKLLLKGISGRPGRWLALINNETLQAGETARVRVGASNVSVRCLAVTEKSAEIEIVATGERRVLLLPGR